MKRPLVTIVIGTAWLGALTGLIYATGGTANAYVHLLYLPIIYTAMHFGLRGGIVAGFVAGIVMMMMPLDTATGAAQSLVSASARLAAFVAVGGFCGWQMERYREEQAETRRLLEESVIALVNIIDSLQSWTAGHSMRVTAIASLIGERLGLSERDMYILRTGGLLHDIGKLSLPPEILEKQGRLTSDELALVQTHPVEGFRILQAFHHPRASAIRDIVRHHHERLDGSGYPDGLKGSEISLFARIVAIADVYEAMTADRPYRTAMSPVQALTIMEQEADAGKLDASLLKHLRALIFENRIPPPQSFVPFPH